MGQNEFLRILCLSHPDFTIIGSIGTISYDLARIDHKKKILIKGAMGAALGCGLGYALAQPKEKVVVVIGEGSLLMHLGSISTILKHNLPNLKVLIINNGQYASCGGQSNNFAMVEHLIRILPQFEIFTPTLPIKSFIGIRGLLRHS
jgi:thiamine pyrophosphate-dependent acetolactate synthase large subunit-like protein